MNTIVIEDHMLDWHSCQICYSLEIKLLLLLLSLWDRVRVHIWCKRDVLIPPLSSSVYIGTATYKTNKMAVRPAKTQISLGIRPVWSEASLCAQWEAFHADLSLDLLGCLSQLLSCYEQPFAGCITTVYRDISFVFRLCMCANVICKTELVHVTGLWCWPTSMVIKDDAFRVVQSKQPCRPQTEVLNRSGLFM